MTHVQTTSVRDQHSDRRRSEQLFTQWHQAGDRQAREELICMFMPMAQRLAARYRGPNESFEDLTQVAIVGLIGAVDRFDPARGAPFLGFAIPTILGELKRHFRNTGWAVHVPRRAQELSLRVARAERELTGTLGRSPTVPELAEYLEVDLEAVLCGLDAGAAHHAGSLEAPVSGGHEDDEPDTLLSRIGTPDESFDLVETRESLSMAIRHLPYRERVALELRLTGQMRQVDIAEELKCSQMQVSRLLARAHDRLREAEAIA